MIKIMWKKIVKKINKAIVNRIERLKNFIVWCNWLRKNIIPITKNLLKYSWILFIRKNKSNWNELKYWIFFFKTENLVLIYELKQIIKNYKFFYVFLKKKIIILYNKFVYHTKLYFLALKEKNFLIFDKMLFCSIVFFFLDFKEKSYYIFMLCFAAVCDYIFWHFFTLLITWYKKNKHLFNYTPVIKKNKMLNQTYFGVLKFIFFRRNYLWKIITLIFKKIILKIIKTCVFDKPFFWKMLPIIWFPFFLLINHYFYLNVKLWGYMLSLTTGFVWFFFACLFFCYFTCSTVYYNVMVGWHRSLYLWSFLYLLLILILACLKIKFPESSLAININSFIINQSRYVFTAWSGLSYLTGWLWHINYFQNIWKDYNNRLMSISIGHILVVGLVDMFFQIFMIVNWPYYLITYPSILFWCLLAGLRNFELSMLNNTQNKFYSNYFYIFSKKIYFLFSTKIWSWFSEEVKPTIKHFLRKFSLFYWILVSHKIFYSYSVLLNEHNYSLILTFFLYIFYLTLMICLALIYFIEILKNVYVCKKNRKYFYKVPVYINKLNLNFFFYNIMPQIILYIITTWLLLWLIGFDWKFLCEFLFCFSKHVNIFNFNFDFCLTGFKN